MDKKKIHRDSYVNKKNPLSLGHAKATPNGADKVG